MSDGTRPGPEKLSLIVLSDDFTRVHYALVMASGALAVGTPVTLFFTMGACRAILAGNVGTPGWHALGGDPVRVDADHAEKRIGRFEELLDACATLGARFIVCEMGLRAINAAPEALRKDLSIEVAGVVTMLADASAQGSIVTF